MIGAGIGVALVCALGNAIAVVMLAAEARRSPDSEAMHASLFARLARRPRWLAAVGVMVVAGMLQITALALAPIAIVQPTLATSQLMLLAYARWRRPEVVGRRETLGSLLVVGGIGCVVAAAPTQQTSYGLRSGLILPMAVVGGLVLVTFALGRAHHRGRTLLIVGAGLAYAWADFVAKLLSNAVDSGTWWLVGVWIGAIIAVGALAFLEENSALQHRLAITVAPVIVAFKVPLPVLMALWSGVEAWQAQVLNTALLLGGLALAAGGAYLLGSSHAVAGVSAGERNRRPREDDGDYDPGNGDAAAKASTQKSQRSRSSAAAAKPIPPTSASDPGASSGGPITILNSG